MRLTSESWTTADFAILRLRFALLLASKCRRPLLDLMSFPVPVTLKRLATDLRVLLRAIDFGMGKVRQTIKQKGKRNQNLKVFWPGSFSANGIYP